MQIDGLCKAPHTNTGISIANYFFFRYISDISPDCALVIAGTASLRSALVLRAFLQRHILFRAQFGANLVCFCIYVRTSNY